MNQVQNEKEQSQEPKNDTFKDQPGLPANEHAKKNAKAASAAKASKKAGPHKNFYSVRGDKLLMITATPKGAYSTYLGRAKKLGKAFVDKKIKEWAAAGVFVDEFDSANLVSNARTELAGKVTRK